jgi:plastocyanin
VAGGLALAGLLVWGGSPRSRVPEIQMLSDVLGTDVWFDPVGLWIEPHQTIRWRLVRNVHTATAYHPSNGKPRRIPEGANPWNSGYLTQPGQTFEVRLDREGVYDYFCAPHEQAGMVGRIVVGSVNHHPAPSRDSLPPAARGILPSVDRIVAEWIVHRE